MPPARKCSNDLQLLLEMHKDGQGHGTGRKCIGQACSGSRHSAAGASTRGSVAMAKAAAQRPTRPSAALLPQCARGATTAAMMEKLQSTRQESEVIESRLRLLQSCAKTQKKRSALQAHQRDWLAQQTELQRERAELESSRALWLEAQVAAAYSGRGSFKPRVGSAAKRDAPGSASALGADESGNGDGLTCTAAHFEELQAEEARADEARR
eukprot:4343203-Pleurochrysis_carterae.AAC.1